MSSQPPSTSPESSPFSPEWVASLPEEERAALALALTPRLTKYIPHQPHPTQAAFLLLDVREALFGGAAGGGKSDALLMAALQYMDVPGYAAILFRRTFPDLNQPDALIPRSHEWLARWREEGVTWNGQDHQWTFPTSDPDRPAVLKFGHLANDNDIYNYQGAAYQFIGFDELTQFTEKMYDYLHGRLRRRAGEDVAVPLRIRGSANPGGIGHEWVKAKFIGTPEAPVRTPGIAFVPSKLEDNPSLDAVEYEKSLDAMSDPVLRAQLRRGDWETRPAGDMLRREWFPIVDEVPAGLRWVRYWDLASTEPSEKNKDPDWTAGALVAVQELAFGAKRAWVRDVRRVRRGPAGVEGFVRSTAEEDGVSVPVWIEQEPGSSGKSLIAHYVTNVLYGFDVQGNPKRSDKVTSWRPLAAQAQAGNVYLLRGPWNGWWLAEAEAAPQPGVHDDGLDAVSGALEKANRPYVLVL